MIRIATQADAESLLSIYAPYVQNTAISFETEVPTAEEFQSRICHTLEKYPYLVYEQDGVILGYAYASPYRSRKAYGHTAELSVYIREDARGKGIGKQLYQAMENELKPQNIYTLYACITYTDRERDEHLTDASIRFHERQGFKLTARFPNCGCKFGQWYGTVWMEKAIGSRIDNPPPFVPWKHGKASTAAENSSCPDEILWTENRLPKGEDAYTELMAPEKIRVVRAFHKSFPEYCPTPLCSLEHMAKELGIASLHVKDESKRFGLNAFKVLGGSYAMASYIAKKLNRPIDQTDFSVLTSQEISQKLGKISFYTATDGNHGRGVAWSAKTLGQRAVVRMPMGTTRARLENIRREGAEVSIENLNYDDCVRLAARQAAECGGVVMQDTAWEGYEEIPSWIMQGYGTMAEEAAEQLSPEIPTHIFIQAGVGSLAGAIVGYFTKLYGEKKPKMIVMEASAAACHYQSALCGSLQKVEGEMSTIMAGLACGEPNPISYRILANHADAFVACPDWVSALGMRLLAAPMSGDPPIISGESGAVGMGLTYALLSGKCEKLRERLSFDENSRILLFSTEGNTDPERYRQIVWGGDCFRKI